MTLADLSSPTCTGADLSTRVNAILLEARSGRRFPSVAAVLADTTMAYNSGRRPVAAGDRVVTADGFAYEVTLSGATDHHLATAGGVRLKVLPGPRGFDLHAFSPAANATTDDSAKLAAARNAALATERRAVYIPGGEYLVATPEAMKFSNGVTTTRGFEWVGEGIYTTNLVLENTLPLADNVLIDVSDDALQCAVRNLRIVGDYTAGNAKFIRVSSAGQGQNFIFEDLYIEGLWNVGEFLGSATASEMIWNRGKWWTIQGPAYSIENPQSVNHVLRDIHIELFFAEVFRIRAGGQILYDHGSLISHPDAVGHVIDIDSTAQSISGNITFHHIRMENRSANMGLVKVRGTDNPMQITFKDCKFDADSSSPTAIAHALDLAAHTTPRSSSRTAPSGTGCAPSSAPGPPTMTSPSGRGRRCI